MVAKKRVRDYKRELLLANRRGDKKYRARVNKARRKAEKEGRAKKGDGKDILHSKKRGKGTATVGSRHANRSAGGKSGSRKQKGIKKK